MATPMASKLPPLRLGKKQIFLPNFVLTLLRPPPITPPHFASFIVPLNLNKLDLRDYLYNAYGVRVLNVRSYIQQQKVRQDKPGAKRPAPRRWYRPRAVKKMMVELEMPFRWPEEPEDFSPWDKTTFDAAQKDNEKMQESIRPSAKLAPSAERTPIAMQAQALLSGKEKWKATKAVWDDAAEAVEVETDVQLPRD